MPKRRVVPLNEVYKTGEPFRAPLAKSPQVRHRRRRRQSSGRSPDYRRVIALQVALYLNLADISRRQSGRRRGLTSVPMRLEELETLIRMLQQVVEAVKGAKKPEQSGAEKYFEPGGRRPPA
ncbi:hypothetical protein F5B17DRAFT_427181 [Nemania serpens]|nr:hypothetical protein F5B17DRAFT_427181 [Nemania serpens]